MRVDFYHMQRSTVEQVLPQLAERVYAGNMRLLIRTAMPERSEHLNNLLWTYHPNAWLPHGTEKDGNESEQPIYITANDDNLNNASVLMLVDGGTLDDIKNFDRCLTLFDGKDEAAVQKARELWKEVVAAGFDAYYWQQNAAGKWEQKAAKTTEEQS